MNYSNKRQRGLTLGKFAPLHKGHQLVIETAVSEMDDVVLIIYDCPDVTPVPLNVSISAATEAAFAL